MIKRRIAPVIEKDLKKKMVILAGPRQCGKTTLANDIAIKWDGETVSYNWDIEEQRRQILKSQIDNKAKLWIFDELHKFRRWRNWLKGQYDQHHSKHSFFVTGSAKLDAYSRGGDSLQGRYYFHRLHPFTLAEILNRGKILSVEEAMQMLQPVSSGGQKTLKTLLTLGGFPEPYSSQSEQEAARWRLTYYSRIIRDEIRSLEQIQDLDRVQLLVERLPVTVGSVLSLNSLREDLEVAFETIRNWVNILERLYAVFRVPPFGRPRIKAVKKEQKLYFWDWAHVEKESARLENLVAMHLLRFVHWQEDVNGEKWELRYFRDVVGHEVDFILLRKEKPYCAIEVKTESDSLDPNLKYLLERVKIPYAFQINLKGEKDWSPPSINGSIIRIAPVAHFLAQLI